MSRWVIVFMLALLPLQFSWAAAASYCLHERAPSKVQHLGHHEHQHQVDDARAQPTKAGDSGMDIPDADCCLCHGLGIAVTYRAVAKPPVERSHRLVASTPAPSPGVHPSPPDRPQWPARA